MEEWIKTESSHVEAGQAGATPSPGWLSHSYSMVVKKLTLSETLPLSLGLQASSCFVSEFTRMLIS